MALEYEGLQPPNGKVLKLQWHTEIPRKKVLSGQFLGTRLAETVSKMYQYFDQ